MQPASHARLEQSTPPQPSAHLHTPTPTHSPRPEQSSGHTGRSHASPVHPRPQLQMTVPSPAARQAPWPEQPSGQLGDPQEGPDQPCRHRQRPGEAHSPRRSSAPQPSAGQTGSAHRRPCQPGWHSQTAFTAPPWATTAADASASLTLEESTHRPCTHPLPVAVNLSSSTNWQVGSSQATPDQPGWQRHSAGLTHSPWPLHAFGQTACSQLGPAQPSKHAHPAAEQRPWP